MMKILFINIRRLNIVNRYYNSISSKKAKGKRGANFFKLKNM